MSSQWEVKSANEENLSFFGGLISNEMFNKVFWLLVNAAAMTIAS